MTSNFRPMRRAKQQLTDEQAIKILESSTSGVLALLGDNDYPYALPISYFYSEGKLYFHGALSGHKIDAVLAHEKASFCVIAQDEVLPAEYTTAYKSVIAFGKVRLLDDPTEKRRITFLLGDKYNPGHMQMTEKAVDESISQMHLIEFEIEHLSGKIGKALM